MQTYKWLPTNLSDLQVNDFVCIHLSANKKLYGLVDNVKPFRLTGRMLTKDRFQQSKVYKGKTLLLGKSIHKRIEIKNVPAVYDELQVAVIPSAINELMRPSK